VVSLPGLLSFSLAPLSLPSLTPYSLPSLSTLTSYSPLPLPPILPPRASLRCFCKQLYEAKAIEPLVATICAHLEPGGTFVMMAPDAPELSRTKLVAGFVDALRACAVGKVDIVKHAMCCYDAYDQQDPSVYHALQRITLTRQGVDLASGTQPANSRHVDMT
jgi:hypothetical protein